jgi:hypothetical protein
MPTKFPACPKTVSEKGLEEYAARLAFGGVFAENTYSSSLVVHHRLADSGLVVLTRFAGQPLKDWAVTHVSIHGDFFHHRSELTFFSLQGALKHFCELAGESFVDTIDDYAR